MTKLACKKCGQSRYVKSGTIRGHQRYLCQDCGCHFTATAVRGNPPAMKALAVLLYAMGNASHEMIAPAFRHQLCHRVQSGYTRKRKICRSRLQKLRTGCCKSMGCHFLSMEQKQGLGLESRRSYGKANPGLGAGWL